MVGPLPLVVIILIGLALFMAWVVLYRHLTPDPNPEPPPYFGEILSSHDHKGQLGTFADVRQPNDTVTLFVNLRMTHDDICRALNVSTDTVLKNLPYFANPDESVNGKKLFNIENPESDTPTVHGIIYYTNQTALIYQSYAFLTSSGLLGRTVIANFSRYGIKISIAVGNTQEGADPKEAEEHYRRVLVDRIGANNFILGGTTTLLPEQWAAIDSNVKIYPETTPSDASSNYVAVRGIPLIRKGRVIDSQTLVGVQF